MPLWLAIGNLGVLILLIGVFLALGVRNFRERVLRPNWGRRHVLDTPRDRASAAREAESIRGPERREALRWRAYWIAQEMADYGEMTDDAEMRLFGLLVKKASMTFINPKLSSPRWRLDRLRDSVDFVAPYLLESDRWWRSKEFNREAARVIYWEDIEKRVRARRQAR
jgi:hypothetical protein